MSVNVLIGKTAPAYAAWSSESRAAHCALARRVKRALDVLAALLIIFAVLPAGLLVALLVACSSPGPVLFRQRRIGMHGRTFTLLKFRTMYHGAPCSAHEAYYARLIEGTAEATSNTFKLRNDPRVTPVGRCLRHLSLDELPQLINVLRGEMSLVGPRPPLPYEVDQYGARELGRLSVTPGLTGLWQVSGRAALNFQQMIDLDLTYIERWSLWLDLKILARTPLAVLTGRGAC